MEHGGERKESMWKKDSGAKDLSGVESGRKSRERAGFESLEVLGAGTEKRGA